MIKFLLISFLICYLIYKVGGYLFKILFWSLGSKMEDHQSFNQSRTENRRPTNGNVDIAYVPKNGQNKKEKDFKGGEYVDYEEIK